MAHIHFFLQGKGGVGKTTCAFYYAQNLVDSGHDTVIIDCDPVNWSLSTFTSIPVQKFDLKSGDGARLDTAKLPKIFNKIDQICRKACAENPDNGEQNFDPESIRSFTDNLHIIFDVGASGFLPILNFLKMGGAAAIQNSGNTIYLHSVIAGDKMFMDCLICLQSLIDAFAKNQDIHIIIWKNQYFGLLGSESDDNQLIANHYELDIDSPTYLPFEKMDIYKNNESKFFAIITVKKYDDDFIQNYVHRLLRGGLTFRSIIFDKDNPSNFNLLEKQFTIQIRDQIYDQLDEIHY